MQFALLSPVVPSTMLAATKNIMLMIRQMATPFLLIQADEDCIHRLHKICQKQKTYGSMPLQATAHEVERIKLIKRPVLSWPPLRSAEANSSGPKGIQEGKIPAAESAHLLLT